jgi:pimeloyl-ACP methyl ester carboxylesterase
MSGEFLFNMTQQPQSRKGNRRRLGLLTLLGAFLLLTLGSGACRSLPKQDLAEQLAALGKNARMGPLSRLAFTADLGQGPRAFELVYQLTKAEQPGDRTPVVLVHSTPSSLFTWTEIIHGTERPVTLGLSSLRDVYAMEVIGHGIAPGDAAPYTFEVCARFVEAAIEALGLEKVHLVGSSYGGEFAWRTALNAPEKIASLTLLDSSGYTRRDEDWLPEELVMRDNSLAKYGWLLNSRERIQSALEPHFGQLPPDRVEEFFLVCENSDNWSAMIDLVVDETGAREAAIPTIPSPTLVVWGEQDAAYSAAVYGRRFAEEIPNSTLVILPATGHYPHEQQPALVLEALGKFFEEQEVAQ